MTFAYVAPGSIDAAVAALAEGGPDAVALAGGTAFTLLRGQRLLQPDLVVGLGRIEELRGIRRDADDLWLGAMATHRQVERSPAVLAHEPALAAAFAAIATVRIRNQATVGGNLAHADPAQDPPPILMALDARAVIAGRDGARRTDPLEGFFVDQLTTVLEPHELIVAVVVPPVPAGVRVTYRKFLPRTADDYATVSVAAALGLDADGRIDHVRVVLGSAGPTPIRAHAVEAALRGERPDPARIAAAAALVLDEVDPWDDARGSAAYKREMARVWVDRALRALAA